MKKNINILNVKLSFIEAVEQLKNDNDVIACVCNNSQKPCMIVLNETNELRIIENKLYDNPAIPLVDRLLHIDDVLEKEWYLIIEKEVTE